MRRARKYFWMPMAISIAVSGSIAAWGLSGGFERKAAATLERYGYRDIKIEGFRINLLSGCAKPDFPYAYSANDIDGKRVRGTVCVTPLWSYLGNDDR